VRLLDHVSQCVDPVVVRQEDGAIWRLCGASDYAGALRHCPTRYVLDDDVVRACTALAYSGGDELAGCLDLIRIPSEELWVEWNEPARLEELHRAWPDCPRSADELIVRTGVLVRADPAGRRGSLHTFWQRRSDCDAPLMAATEVLIDLDHESAPGNPDGLLAGATIVVHEPSCAAVDRVMRGASFRLVPSWQHYYASASLSAEQRRLLVEQLLAAVASDVPMLLSLFLLVSLRGSLTLDPVCAVRLNAKRIRNGKRPLLDHIEVSSPILAEHARRAAAGVPSSRRGPRFHPVRGHIVRRGASIYWRGPHWRGHLRLGSVRTRTVALRLHERPSQSIRIAGSS
jgi:hypothetical protein